MSKVGSFLIAAAWMTHSTHAATPPSPAFLQKYCAPCHGSVRPPQGGLDLVKLAYTPESADNFATWVKIHDRVSAGEMPPAGLPRPDAKTLSQFTQALSAALTEYERGVAAKKPDSAASTPTNTRTPCATSSASPGCRSRASFRRTGSPPVSTKPAGPSTYPTSNSPAT